MDFRPSLVGCPQNPLELPLGAVLIQTSLHPHPQMSPITLFTAFLLCTLTAPFFFCDALIVTTGNKANELNGYVPNFYCKDKPQISRFPDTTDCTKFIYCVSGTPHSAKCWPEGARFNPQSSRCDLPPTAECGPPTTTTTPRPTSTTPLALATTATTPRPTSTTPLALATTTTTPRPTSTTPLALATTTTTPRPTSTTPLAVATTTTTNIPTTITPENSDQTQATESFPTLPPVNTPQPLLTTPPANLPTPTIALLATTGRVRDTFDFSLDCGGLHPCGLYPNHNGNCSTFILCTEGGGKTLKHCHGGQLFDVDTMECHEGTEAQKEHCWQQPHSGPFISMRQPPPDLCQFHNLNASQFQLEASAANNTILSNPVVTNWGEWGQWLNCPNGSYANGINAWRRLLQIGARNDHAGLISLALECRQPDGVVTKVLDSVAPGAPNDGFASFYSCSSGGSGVGFRLNSQPDQGPDRDNLATDNVQLLCSCGSPVHKPYENIAGPQSGNRGDWTQEQVCGAKSAICGVRMQFAVYKEGLIGQYDNTGLNNVKMKCCPIPEPVEECVPEETTEFIRSCVNSQGIYPRRCDFQATVGLSYALDDARMLRSVNFYQSVGYSLDGERGEMLQKRFEDAAQRNVSGKGQWHYSWEESHSHVWSVDNLAWVNKSVFLDVNISVFLLQVVGNCGHFRVRTNRILRQITDLSTGNKFSDYFDIEM